MLARASLQILLHLEAKFLKNQQQTLRDRTHTKAGKEGDFKLRVSLSDLSYV